MPSVCANAEGTSPPAKDNGDAADVNNSNNNSSTQSTSGAQQDRLEQFIPPLPIHRAQTPQARSGYAPDVSDTNVRRTLNVGSVVMSQERAQGVSTPVSLSEPTVDLQGHAGARTAFDYQVENLFCIQMLCLYVRVGM